MESLAGNLQRDWNVKPPRTERSSHYVTGPNAKLGSAVSNQVSREAQRSVFAAVQQGSPEDRPEGQTLTPRQRSPHCSWITFALKVFKYEKKKMIKEEKTEQSKPNIYKIAMWAKRTLSNHIIPNSNSVACTSISFNGFNESILRISYRKKKRQWRK